MSYLGVPRIHFMGLFYSAPGNLNNKINNFDLSKSLIYDTGLYKYQDGTAQLYLSHCKVTSVAGTDGRLCHDPGLDSLVGARVTSPGPETQKPDGKDGLHGFAKIVDLDANMQFRTEIYGLRIYVDIGSGGGFSGELAAPALRDIWFSRGDGGITGLQVAVATWHQRLTNVVWTKPAQRSPVYDALKDRSENELDVKIGVDMFQTQRGDEFSVGNRFGYGRLVAAIGPTAVNEPKELVPGRRLYSPLTFKVPSLPAKTRPARMEFTREAAEDTVAVAASEMEWNRTDFRICDVDGGHSFLIIDLFNAAPLTKNKDGKFVGGDDVVVGFAGGGPLTNGAIKFAYSKPPGDPALNLKDVYWPDDAAIFQIELTVDERKKIATTPLAIKTGGREVARENPNGVYVNIDRPSIRLQPNESYTFDMYAYEFGRPAAKMPPGLKVEAQLYKDQDHSVSEPGIFSATLDPTMVGPGHFRLFVKTLDAVPLTDERKPLDSCLCLVPASGTGYLVGEAMAAFDPDDPPTPPLLTLLFWQNHKVVAQPTWDANIHPLLAMYARLFPGMVSIMDISDLATVKAKAGALIDRFERARSDPGFMPVSRDMSPATVDMVLRFLRGLVKEQS